MATRSLLCLVITLLLGQCATAAILSSRLIHRFSDEVKTLRVSKGVELPHHWPSNRNLEYYQLLVDSDVHRQKMKLGPHYQLLFPSEGSKTMSFGNDLAWLHYTWVNIGTPSVSFLVALDTGTDLFWVPCNCVQCAHLSAGYYTSLLDKDLNEYNPTGSSTSKHLNCSHQLCEIGLSNCKSPMQACPYTVHYSSEDTVSSGVLVEDILHLDSDDDGSSNVSVKVPVIIGCGRKQSGGFLEGAAPDGLLGLGLGNISVPSFLYGSGMVRNSFSVCFNADNSGTIFFGDQGPSSQQTTSFLPWDENYLTYIVAVEDCCIGGSCLVKTDFKAVVDTGTSFTFLPQEMYEKVAKEFDEQINATATTSFGEYPWKYCYKSSSEETPKIPKVTFKFASNSSLVIRNPAFFIHDNEVLVGFCLAIQPAELDIAIIGQNFLTGYRLVFDRENLKLGWSLSDCKCVDCDDKNMPLNPKDGNTTPLPTNSEQQSAPGGGRAVTPVEAGKTPTKSSSSSASTMNQRRQFSWFSMMMMLVLLLPLSLHLEN